MTKDQAINFFGSAARLADILGIERQAVYQWVSVPPLRQLQIQNISNGDLLADADIAKAPAIDTTNPSEAA